MLERTSELQLNMKEIAPNIYRIRIPSLKSFGQLNSYLIRGEQKSALVDVGFNDPVSKQIFDAALDRVGVSWDEVSILATHAHADHLGGLEHLWRKDMPVYSSMNDLSQQRRRLRTRFENFLPAFKAFRQKNPEVGPILPEEVEAALYSPRVEAPICTVHDGDILEFGDYRIEVIETPGHDFCEICFWEPQNGLLFSGDHIIESVTPSIYAEGFNDELAEFFQSLRKIRNYDADLILPGHGHEFTDIQASTQKIINHHRRRVEQTYEIITSGTEEFISIVYDLTSQPNRIPWGKRSSTAQWKAVCETIGYLNYLEYEQRIERSPQDESFCYHTI